MTKKKSESRSLVLRFMAVGVVCMLVLAGQGASQVDEPDNVHHALREQVEHALTQLEVDMPADTQDVLLDQAFLDPLAVFFTNALSGHNAPLNVQEILLLVQLALRENPFLLDHPDLLQEANEELAELLDPLVTPQPMGQCMHDDFEPIPELGLITGPACLLIFLIAPALILATIVLSVVAPLAVNLAVEAAKVAAYLDENADGIGDDWGDYWRKVSASSLANDWDDDELNNVHEFRWELYPFCMNSLPDDSRTQLVDESGLSASNCTDYDEDNWMDGPEVKYWNNVENDALLVGAGVTFLDPDRTLDTNDDSEWNTRDPDSDGDGILDGYEIQNDTYPEYADSDCAMFSAECTLSSDTSSYWDQARLGQPGSGDHINDADELAYWNTIDPDAWKTDWDGDGIWNNLLDPDSDGDGALDGDEILAGTDPSDPDDGTQNTIAQNDPTNENLPEELMDPTNLQYLRDGRVDAEEEAEEIVAVIDQAISAAIAGNVTEALNVIYEATPIAPLVPNPVQTVELAQDALLALIKCIDTDPEALADTETTATDTAQCARGVLVPFLDALLSRTVEQLPLVGDTVAELRQETLPGIIDTVDSIVPLELQATSEALLDDPVGATQQATLDAVDLISDPENIEEAVTQTHAAVQIAVADLIQASSRHPQFLYDTVVREGIDAHWPAIQEANDGIADNTGVEPIAVVDSFVFNLYTNRAGDEAIMSIPVGERTCVQLSDTDASTRDASGCDLYATLAVSTDTASNPGGAPSPGKRVSPSLQIETALPAASFELEAIGYLQLPDSPHIIALGYATTGDGQPTTWTGTLLDYDAKQAWTDRSIAYASSYDDDRTSIPLHLVAGSFEVEVSEPNKPVVEGEATVLELESQDTPPSVSLDTRRLEVEGEHRVEASIESNGDADWDVLHLDGFGNHESRLQFTATNLPSGTNRVTQTASGTTAASWQWTSPDTTDAFQATYRETLLNDVVRAYDATATDAPSTILVRTDAQSHTHAYQATAAPTQFDLLVGEGTDACPGLTGHHFTVEQESSTLCITAGLDGYTQLQAQDLDTRLQVTGTRAAASTAGTTVIVRDGNTAYAKLPASPASWTGTFSSNPGNTRLLDWTASQSLSSLALEAELAGTESLRVALDDVPSTVTATLDATRGLGELSASDYIGQLDWITSTTGTAPSATSLADHVRMRERSAGIEASWSIGDVQEVVARVAEDGAWEATGSFDSPRPLEVYYEDETHTIQLEAASVSGDFIVRVADDAEAGLFTYTHDLNTATSSIRLAGSIGDNNVLVDATNAPSDVSLTARLDAQTVSLDANGAVGSLEAKYAPNGVHPTSNENSFLVVGGTAAPRPGLHLNVDGFSALDVTRSLASLDLASTTSSNPPLLLRFEQQDSATVLDLEAVPDQATLVHGESAVIWSSTAASTSFDYLVRGASAASYLSASVIDAPESLTLTWTPRSADSFEASLSHSAIELQSLEVEDHRQTPDEGSPGDAGFRFEANDAPSSVSVRFEPTQGRLTATATNAAGAPRIVDFLDVGFGERRSTRLQAPYSPGGVRAFLDESGGSIAGALQASDFESLSVRLFGDEGQTDAAGTMHVERDWGGSVYVRADSESRDAHGIIHYSSAPADIETSLWPGSAGGGLRIESHAASSAGALTAKLVRDGRSLAASTVYPTPADLEASWTPGSSVEVTASTPTTLRVQATPRGAEVPGHGAWDHVVAKQDGGSVFGLHLTNVESFVLDSSLGVLDANVGGGVPLVVDYAPGVERLRLEANPLPSVLGASWSPALRSITVDASLGMTRFLISTDPGDAGGQRLLGILDGVPSGVSSFSALPDGSFEVNAPSPLSRARITSDQGVGPASLLDGDGVRVQASGEQPTFFLNVPDAKHVALVLPAAAAPRLELEATGGSSFEARLGLPGQRLMASLNGLPGDSVLSWPSATQMLFSVTGAPGDTVLGFDAGSKRGEVGTTNGPDAWSLEFTEAGVIDYSASGSASGLEAFGAWHGAAFKLDADGVPSGVAVEPASGMQSGSITATGNVNRLYLALTSSSGSGAAVVPSVNSTSQDVFSVDTTTGGGLLSVDLPDVQSLSWELPDSVGRVTGTPLTLDLQRSLASSRAAVVQAMHPDHQSFASFPSGLPANLDVDLARSTTKWVLGMDSGGKDYLFQHQGGDAGSLRLEAEGPPGSSTLSFEPKATRSLDYSANGGTPKLVMQSRWNAGYVDVNLTDAPSALRVDTSGVTLEAGSVSTLGSGSVGQAQLLVVPDGENDVNRVNPGWEHFAVEVTGKTPYLGLNLTGLTEASWQLPEATGNRPVETSIQRLAGVQGDTWVVLSGPREDVTVKAVDAGPVMSLLVNPSTNSAGNLNPNPLFMEYDGAASEVSVSHIHGESGQVASANFEDLAGGASVEATGIEPSFVDVTVGGASGYEFQTTDGGTALHVAVEEPTPRLRAEVTRGTCGATSPGRVSVSTLQTGATGPAIVKIGDEGRAPENALGNAVVLQCEGSEAHAGVQVPFISEVLLEPNECGGIKGIIPADDNVATEAMFLDSSGIYTMLLLSSNGPGALDVEADCAGMEYTFTDALGGPARIGQMDLDYRRVQQLSETTGGCILFQDRCINDMSVKAIDFPPHVEAFFTGPNGLDGFRIFGGQADSLDIRVVLEKAPKEENVKLTVVSEMPFESLRFTKTDRSNTDVGHPSPNAVLWLDDPGQDTIFAQMEKVTSIDVELEKRGTTYLRAVGDYSGSSGRELDMYLLQADCSQIRATISNLPSHLDFEALMDLTTLQGGFEGRSSSNAIPWVRGAYRLGASCGNQDAGLDVFAFLEDIPAGPWTAGFRHGKAGYLGVHSETGTIGSMDVGLADPGNSHRYISVHFENARLYAEWDLDGQTDFKGNPYYVFCDYMADRFTLRLRFDNFGLGFRGADPGVGMGCDEFQLGWKFITVPVCTISISFPTTCAQFHVPKIGVAGRFAISIDAPLPTAEVLYAGKWYKIPTRLWLP